MPSRRKRATPVTDSAHRERTVNAKAARTTIRKFHVLLKRKAQLEKKSDNKRDNESLVAEVEHEIDTMGGLDAYQVMSRNGQSSQRGGGSHHTLIRWLLDLGCKNRTESNKYRLLEVGALYPDNYSSCSKWMDVMPIDLNASAPGVTQQDLLLMDTQENKGHWDCISLSLVLNFAPEPKSRGRMLQTCHGFLVEGGFLFVVLPAPCIRNSRYLDRNGLLSLMGALGFTLVQEKSKPSGKVVYYLFRKVEVENSGTVALEPWRRKQVALEGNHRNNFCILFPS